MSYIDEIFARLDIQHLREFLLHGVEEVDITMKSDEERIDEKQKLAIEMIKQKFPDMDEYEQITCAVYDYAAAIEDAYMEIGMKCGAVLAVQLLGGGSSPITL